MNFWNVLLVLALIWLLTLTLFLVRAARIYRKLMGNSSGQDLLGLWRRELQKAEKSGELLEDLRAKVSDLRQEGKDHLQKVGLTRFNPYGELGGNQSFAVSLLDEKGNGVVLSGLYGRDSTRIYAKPVKNFAGTDFELSQEEKDAIHTSQHS